MSERDDLIRLAAETIDDTSAMASLGLRERDEIAEALVDTLHDRLVPPEPEWAHNWTWCEEWGEPVRLGECDDPSLPDGCPGPHRPITVGTS